ncbi:MAG: type VI secretion system protein [Pseudomonadota bacterium]
MPLALPSFLGAARAAAGLAAHRLFGTEDPLPGCAHPVPPPAWPERLARLTRAVIAPARRRYDTPWLLLLGEAGAGKSSLAASVAPALRSPGMPWPGSWPVPGMRWWLFEQGALIDPDGKVAAAAGRPWRALLRSLEALRPERPLDGVVIAVAAHTLATPGALADAAATVRRQLDSIALAYGYVLPAYVVITGADKVPGFSAYWRAVGAVARSEMLGWSAPTAPDAGTPAQWAAKAFQALGAVLRARLLHTAAGAAPLAQADQVFLFPYHLGQLQPGFARWLDTVFQPDCLPGAWLVRGIYLCGSVAADGADSHAVRSDVDFVDDLVGKKVLAERALARPARAGIWARSRLLRTVQAGIAGALLAMGLAVLLQSWALRDEADALVRATTAILKVDAAPPSCLDQAQAFSLLARVGHMHPALDYLPWSAVSDRAGRRAAQLAAERALAGALLPGLQCQLKARAGRLLAFTPRQPDAATTPAEASALARENLFTFLDQLARLEAAAGRLKELEGKRAAANPDAAVQALNDVVEYVYGTPAPGTARTSSAWQDWLEQVQKSLWKALGSAPPPAGTRPWRVEHDGGVYWALRELDAPALAGIDDSQRTALQGWIVRLSSGLGDGLVAELSAGKDKLGALARLADPAATVKAPATLLSSARDAHDWLDWVSLAWLPATAEDNPCQQLGAGLRARRKALPPYLGALETAAARLDAAHCYDKARAVLAGMEVAPLDKIVDPARPGSFGAKVLAERDGLAALLKEDFMQVPAAPSLSCQATQQMAPAALKRATAYATAWLAFKKLRVPENGAPGTPRLYAGLGLHQLKQAMGAAIAGAQQAVPDGDGVDATLSQASSQFATALPAIDEVLGLYEQAALLGSATLLRNCVRTQAGTALGQVNTLKDKLYATPAGQKDGTLFALGGSAALARSLEADLARVKILAGYAAPFAKYLGEHASASAASISETNPYWSNTVKEVNQALAGDTKGQVGKLNDFFSKTLLELDSKNCSKKLEDAADQPGDDLFAASQRLALEQANARCGKLDRGQMLQDYTKLRDHFEEIAGHYPFGETKSDALTLEQVRKFFSSYGKDLASLRSKAEAMGEAKASWEARRRFLVALDDAATALKPLLATDAELTLNIGFNARASESPGASEIVEWRFSSGEKTVTWPRTSPSTVKWRPGQPLLLELEWADTSPWRPAARPEQAGLLVKDTKASFSHGSDAWALLRLLAQHRDDNSDDNHAYPFQVPVALATASTPAQGSDVARLFLGMSVTAKDPKTQALTTLKFPASLPATAPR